MLYKPHATRLHGLKHSNLARYFNLLGLFVLFFPPVRYLLNIT